MELFPSCYYISLTSDTILKIKNESFRDSIIRVQVHYSSVLCTVMYKL